MAMDLKKWAGLGLTTAVLGTGLVACGGEDGGESGEVDNPPAEETLAGEMGEGEGGEGEGGEGEAGDGEAGEGIPIGELSRPERLAFMSGHVVAGIALYRAGDTEMAAMHLEHPISESDEGELKGLAEIGFDQSIFIDVVAALKAGRPASEVEAQLAAAEANLAMVAERAGGDPVEIISYLMRVTAEEYTIAMDGNTVKDLGEYQDAYGFAVVARQQADRIDPPSEEINTALDELIALWPEDAPIPPENPTPLGRVLAQTSKVILALPQR